MASCVEQQEYTFFVRSQCVLLRLVHAAAKTLNDDDVVFLPFRSRLLTRQRAVYTATLSVMCAICMHDTFPEMIKVQHNTRHPAICRRCASKLVVCPFCREPLCSISEEDEYDMQPLMIRLIQLYSVRV